MTTNPVTRRAVLAGAALAAPTLRELAGRGAAAAAAAPSILEYATWQAEEPGFGAWWKEVTTAFAEAHPGQRIAMTQIPFRDYLDQLTIRFASNRPPPLLELPSDSLGAFASQDWLAPLDARIKGMPIETDWSSLQRDMVWDGKTMGVLLMGYAFMMFYNQKLLDEAGGVSVPTDWPSFCAAVPRITNRERGIFGLSAVTTEYPTIPLDFIRSIVWPGASLTNGTRWNLTDPKVVAAIETYRSVVSGNAPPGVNSTVIRQLFTDGKTGFLVDGPWVWALLDRAPPAVRPHLKMVKAPFAPPLGGASNSIHIAAGLDQATEEAAWSFIAFLAQPEWQQRYTVLAAAPAARQRVLTPELEAQRPELKAINEAVLGAQSTTPANQALRANYNEFNKILQRAAVKVLSTGAPVAEIMRQTQAELDQAVPLG